jgi:hypothetical protein
MSEQANPDTPRLLAWLSEWPEVRQEIETLMLANLELKDLDEAVKRVGALGKLLRGGDLTAGELEATANT